MSWEISGKFWEGNFRKCVLIFLENLTNFLSDVNIRHSLTYHQFYMLEILTKWLLLPLLHWLLVKCNCIAVACTAHCTGSMCMFPLMMMIRQFIRRRNMSMKSLQGRHTPGSCAQQRQMVADPWTKPTDLSHWPAFRQLSNYIHHRHHYYSARKLILILPSRRG